MRLIDPKVLANIKSSNPSAYDIWVAANGSESRWFFENRYILPPELFENLLSKEAGSGDIVWQYAAELSNKYEISGYPASVIIIALLKTIPDIEQGLRQGALELKDIELGIGWIKDIDAKRRLAKEKKYFGGLARDCHMVILRRCDI